MNDFFKTIQTDIEQLEASLAFQIPFFRYDGNVYLIADNKFKSILLLREYEKLCKLNLNFEDIQKLKPIAKSYRNLLAMLALEMQKDFKKDEDLKSALDKTDLDLSGNLLIKKFAQIKQQIQRLLTELNTYLISSYSLKTIPAVTIQDNLQKNLKNFKYNTDEIDMIVDLEGLKTDGLPDLNKIKIHEQKTSKIKIDLSTQSELLEKIDLLERWLPDFANNQLIKDAYIAGLEVSYEEIFTFAYQQLNVNKLSLNEVTNNTKQKFGSIKILCKQKLEKSLELLLEDLKNIKQDKEFAPLFKNFLDKFDGKFSEEQLFNFSNPRFYEIQFREANVFENATYNSRISVDVNFHPELFNGVKTIVSTFALVPSPEIYELAGILVCGNNYNKAWREKVLLEDGLNPVEKFVENTYVEDELPQAIQNADKFFTNLISQ